jgi:5-formyltetrahydrofolate cyclo-ligase
MTLISKLELRKTLLSKRRQVTATERQIAGQEAAKLFSATEIFQQSQHIACYYPLLNEFDCLPIIQEIWAAKKNCYLPVSTTDKKLDFLSYQENTKLQPNQYLIFEPVGMANISLDELDIVLLPLVGFDSQGNRLGMGGGYYDRTFEIMRNTNNQKCLLIGLAYEFQQVPALPEDPWDVALDGVLTEERIIFV